MIMNCSSSTPTLVTKRNSLVLYSVRLRKLGYIPCLVARLPGDLIDSVGQVSIHSHCTVRALQRTSFECLTVAVDTRKIAGVALVAGKSGGGCTHCSRSFFTQLSAAAPLLSSGEHQTLHCVLNAVCRCALRSCLRFGSTKDPPCSFPTLLVPVIKHCEQALTHITVLQLRVGIAVP